MKIGDKVIVGKRHWLRPHDVGIITDEKDGRWLVEFERIFVGGGIMGGDEMPYYFADRQYLWLEETQLEHIG